VFFAEQHHVQITGGLAVDLQWRGTEYLAPVGTARVIAEDRQRLVIEQTADRRQIDSLPAQMAFWRRVADNPPLAVEQVHLDTRVDQHQLAEQFAHGTGHQAIAVHQHRVMGDVLRQVPRQALHHFQFMHLAGAHLQPCRGAAAHQQQNGEHQRQALRQVQSHGCSVPNL